MSALGIRIAKAYPMIILTTTLIFFVLVIWFVPSSWWEYLYDRTDQLLSILKKVKSKGKGNSSVYSGEMLLFKLSLHVSELSVGKAGSSIELNPYKFYTGLIEELFNYKRQFGIPLNKILITLRKGIKKDFQFEKKIQGELAGGIVQFIFIALITWFFSFMVYQLVQLNSGLFIKMVMGFLQIAGIGTYYVLYRKRKQSQFSIFEIYYRALFTLVSLMDVGLPSSKILKSASIETIFDYQDKHLVIVREKLKGLIESYKNNGQQIKTELEGIIEEIDFLQEERFDRFLKFLGLLKFSILCLFFLSAYFVYLFTLFSSFLME